MATLTFGDVRNHLAATGVNLLSALENGVCAVEAMGGHGGRAHERVVSALASTRQPRHAAEAWCGGITENGVTS